MYMCIYVCMYVCMYVCVCEQNYKCNTFLFAPIFMSWPLDSAKNRKRISHRLTKTGQ